MEMIVKGRRMEVTPAIRDYAEEKIGRVAKILDSWLMSAEVELYTERNRSIEKGQVAEVTVYTKGPVIRAKEAASDMYAAIDLVSEKLERQVRKYKTKTVSAKPMSTEEAVLQMELLGHDFFVYRSEDTEGMNVLYRRHDGDYGLITSV
jgi:putative sigma-54 modulation protein